ncbi:MAG: T9SS type A sorting domain-containing protein, partial [Ignavibacteriae bacterium]|nr:T9SS type A sorting domain-containing protein [Ignavibacteriota bacterium]
SLSQNYPNPFNPTTNIRYALPRAGEVKLTVFNTLGKEVETLVNEHQSAGTYEVSFDASQYPSGVYFYRLTTDNFSDTKRMLLVK